MVGLTATVSTGALVGLITLELMERLVEEGTGRGLVAGERMTNGRSLVGGGRGEGSDSLSTVRISREETCSSLERWEE